MIEKLLVCHSDSVDPYRNLALEQVLLESVREGECILYLWQNENTVVIGRNQNPWKECLTALLEQEGGRMVRRLSGGGAVFHDLGNLNFTFLMPQTDYDLDRQLSVIQNAVASFGIPTQRSGRNDILADGNKFSGNAFYKNGKQAYHHGTLLVDADLEKLGRYLTPSKAKLQSKGVDSVRSRVCNLRQCCPRITIADLKTALMRSFSQVYGLSVDPLDLSDADLRKVAALTERNRSWEWNFGKKIPFTMECEARFPWGTVQISLRIDNGVIQDVGLWSDSMDWTLAPAVRKRLCRCRFTVDAIQSALGEGTSEERDIAHLLCSLCGL